MNTNLLTFRIRRNHYSHLHLCYLPLNHSTAQSPGQDISLSNAAGMRAVLHNLPARLLSCGLRNQNRGDGEELGVVYKLRGVTMLDRNTIPSKEISMYHDCLCLLACVVMMSGSPQPFFGTWVPIVQL